MSDVSWFGTGAGVGMCVLLSTWVIFGSEKQDHRLTLKDMMKCGLWGHVLQNTKCVCLFSPTHHKVYWGWLKCHSSPTWHLFGLFLVMWATRQSSENTPVVDKNPDFSLSKEIAYPCVWMEQAWWVVVGFMASFVQREADEITPPCFCCVCSRMNPPSQCIKVKQFDLYFKDCDYSGGG